MPRRLLARCQPDSVREFRASARQRYDDGLTAVAGGRGLAAIYLWGYCAEMLLKAAYFSVLGIGEETALQLGAHIEPAIQLGRGLGIAWPPGGRGHNVRAWAELLILERATHPNPAMAYPMGFGDQVQANGQRISQLWNETLRYHKNTPYSYEVSQVRQAAEWLIVNSALL
jgi:hypothetical protein